jgi:septal ring factor EnvC (AmiA/AmiB activator)
MKPFALSSLLRPAALALVCLSFSSCGDDPELVRKREEQKAEIRLLDGELKILQERISNIPPDRSAEISRLKTESESQQAQVAALEQEIESLQKQKAQIEKDHEAYRRKYVAR